MNSWVYRSLVFQVVKETLRFVRVGTCCCNTYIHSVQVCSERLVAEVTRCLEVVCLCSTLTQSSCNIFMLTISGLQVLDLAFAALDDAPCCTITVTISKSVGHLCILHV